MEIILGLVIGVCGIILYFILNSVEQENKDLKEQRNELERENLELTTRLNQLKINMEV